MSHAHAHTHAHALGRPLALLLLALLLAASAAQGKTISRRTDKISENFKQLDLPPEEIDPNVAPPEPHKPALAAAAPLVDVSANEIASGDTAPVAAAPAAAAAAATEAAVAEAGQVAEAAEAAVTEATEAAKPKPKPKPKPQDEDKNPISRYCKCTESHCDCCRKFGLPLLPSGPGCAKIAYLGNDEMSVSLKFGDITLASRRISSKRARPICVSMPGGYSKFCGRVYGLSRAQENFKACLAFELRAEDEVEAQLPISCFKFGSEGLRVADAEPLPTKVKQEEDDDDDIFGFGAGGDDDEDEDEDDYDEGEAAASTEDDDTDDYADDDEAPEEADYGGFSLGGLLDELDDDEDEKPSKKPAVPVAAAPAAGAATPLADQTTREHIDTTDDGQSTDPVQSKDDAGSVAATPIAEDTQPTVAGVALTEAPPAAAAAEAATTTATAGKKSKKAKKNKQKKKKAASDTAGEGDFAYELLNGILDFFN